MTQKRRSKVREAAPAPVVSEKVSMDQLKAAAGGVESLPPEEELQPLGLVEDRTKEQLIADGDYPVVPVEWKTPEQLVELYPDPSGRHVALIREQEAATMQHFAEGCEQTMLSRPEPETDVFATVNGERVKLGDLSIVYPSNALHHVDGELSFKLEPLWVERLEKMATKAAMTPHAYLELLLRRAWCSMPSRDRTPASASG